MAQLYTGGRMVDILCPSWRDFDPEPTAKALAHINRFAGNYRVFSVAQHAVLVSEIVEELGGDIVQCIGALHHDDGEIVIGDVPSPVKELCPGLQQIEFGVQQAINVRYRCDVNDELVKEADMAARYAEVHAIVPEDERHHYTFKERPRAYVRNLVPWTPEAAERRYIQRHIELEQALLEERYGVCQGEA